MDLELRPLRQFTVSGNLFDFTCVKKKKIRKVKPLFNSVADLHVELKALSSTFLLLTLPFPLAVKRRE